MEYGKLFDALYKAEVRALICGGLAVNIYGIPRMTADIDLLVDFEKSNLEKFNGVLSKLSYQPVVPIPISQLSDEINRNSLIREKNLIAYSYYNSISNYMNVDVLIDTPISFGELWIRRESRKVGEYEVNLVSPHDLITMKNYANRKQDQDDVIMLSKLYPKK